MSTTPTPVQPLSVSLVGGTLNEILLLLSTALSVLSAIPATAPEGALGSLVLQIVTAAVQRIESQTGQPIDLTKIPQLTPLP